MDRHWSFAEDEHDSGSFWTAFLPVGSASAFAPEIDEFVEAGLTKLASTRVKLPRIAESPAAFECRLLQAVELGPNRWIAIGQVLLGHIEDRAVLDAERLHIDTAALDLVARVQDGNYAQLGAAFGPNET